MGQDAAADVSRAIASLLEQKPTINMIFAAAPSQNEFLDALVCDNTIDFSRINAFHMDEYIGLSKQRRSALAIIFTSICFQARSICRCALY